MPDLTDEQRNEVNRLLRTYLNRARKTEDLYREGQVEQDLSNFFSGIASRYQKGAICCASQRTVEEAQGHFRTASKYFLQSAQESNIGVMSTNSLTRGIYTAALAGDSDGIRELAELTRKLHETADVDPSEWVADRFYLSGCLAGAVTGDIVETEIESLEAVNETKPPVHALYGSAILSFVKALDESDPEGVKRGIQRMVEYHVEEYPSDDIFGLLMAPQATALFVIAKSSGFEVTVDSEHVPTGLVESAVLALKSS
ncbi:hypothetical protein [Haloarchaeobius sp. DFWS5]|uniref:hypothetical protein n=1 Tax=Haloarchaeobius sp. DFWS5 TaxID=3446114 RepID=UPI003EC0DF2C